MVRRMSRVARTTAVAALVVAPFGTACSGHSEPAAATQASHITGAPGLPRLLTAHGGDQHMTLEWKPPRQTGGGDLHYRVRHSTSKAGPWHTFATGTVTAIGTNRPGPGSYWDVYAYNDAGRSTATQPVKAP